MEELRRRLRAPIREWAVMAIFFTIVGTGMNAFGHAVHLAHFLHEWQVLTCYLGYVLPLAMAVRRDSWWMQYCICVTAFIFLEVPGYAMGSSIAENGNAFETVFGVRNFTAVMVAAVGLIPPIGLRLAAPLVRWTAATPSPAV